MLKTKGKVLTELSGCKLLRNVCFMHLVISNPVSTVSNSLLEGDKVLPSLTIMWFYSRNVKKEVHLEVSGRIILNRIFTFEWEKLNGLLWLGMGKLDCFVNMIMNISVSQCRMNLLIILERKFSLCSALDY